MSEETFTKIVQVWSQVVPDLQSHQDVLTKFIYLIEKIDGLPEMERRFHREGLSFYHAISKNRTITDLEEILKVFFEDPPISTVSTPEESVSQGVSAEHLGGVQGEQVLFVKKIGEAEFYGALWPWKDKDEVVTVHLGVCSPDMTEENHGFMYSAMKGHLTENTSAQIDVSVRGLIQGVSLSSFLQMSEMEGSTCTLEVKAGKKTGTLHLLNGNLIDAETGSLKHKEAAFKILGWENAEIYIQKPSGRKKNEISLPLMHILIEALKKKDKIEFEKDVFANKLDDQIEATDIQTKPDEQPESISTEDSGDIKKEDVKAGGAGPISALDGQGNKPGQTTTLGPIGKKKRTPLIVAAVVVILLAGAGAFWLLMGGNGGSAAEEYTALMEKIEIMTDESKKEKLLNAFIDSHTDDPVYTDKAMQALFSVLSKKEALEYEKAVGAVFDLPLDRNYHQKAEKIFNDFLQRHPESRFRDDITKRLAEINALTDDALFGELNTLGPRDYLGRLKACEDYLKAYPAGLHREEVKALVRQTVTASYREFSNDVQKCKRQRKWDECLATCRQYRDKFQRYMNMTAVDKIEAELLGLQALDALKAETQGADDETVRKLYLAYLETYPDSSERSRLEKRVTEIEKKLSAKDEWMRVKTIGQDTTKTLSHRIAVLRRHIDQNPDGPYFIEAENLLWKLEQQARPGTTAGGRTMDGNGRTASATADADKGKTTRTAQDNAARLESLKQKVSADLAETKGRYVVTRDGTVQDTLTGLDWTMLDSFEMLDRCVDYRQAVAYVQQLKDGGHNDWRMPTSAELAGIYQNSPHFPPGGAKWYWSSEVYEKGYQTIVNIVNAEPEAVYRKRTAGIRKCGSVRAVRP